MLRLLPKVVLLVAFLATLVINSVPAFAGNRVCACLSCLFCKNSPPGGCTFDKKTLQCINTGCKGLCQ